MTAIKDAIDLITQKSNGLVTTADQIASLMTDGGAVAMETIYSHKEPRVAGAAASAAIIGQPLSMWQFEGTPLTHGAVPTVWANPTRATLGGFQQANPGGGRTKLMLSLIAGCQNGGYLIIGDRLGHMGGLDGTLTTAQNVNGGSPGAPTRNTGGVGNLLLIEIYTAVGATATTITANYTNDQGTAGQVTQPIVFGGASRQEAQRVMVMSLAAGDKGVRSVTSVTVLATTGTAGNFGVTLFRPLMCIPFASATGCGHIINALNHAMSVLDTDACLSMIFVPTVAALPITDIVMNNVEVAGTPGTTTETIHQWKELRLGGAAYATASMAGKELSMWQAEGSPSHGAAPGAFANPTNATAGSLMQTDPAGGKQKWLTSLMFPGGYIGSSWMLMDRLMHAGGFSGIVTTAQNLNGGSPATLTRHYADSTGALDVGNQIFIEINAALGATGTTVTAVYANENGVSHTTQAVTIGGTSFFNPGRWIQLPLAAGDRGVQSVTSVTLAGTTGTAGAFSVVVVHPLLHLPVSQMQPDSWQGAIDTPGNIEIKTGACLFWSCLQSAGATSALLPALPLVQFSFVDK